MARPFEHITPNLRTWGAERARILILPGAGQGTGCWEPVGRALAERGLSAACLEYPGHGDEPWRLPPGTGLADYTLMAARAAGGLGRPVLVGHCLGGWLAQRVLSLANLPALLLAPWPAQGDGLVFTSPGLGWALLRGKPLAAGLLPEPLGLRWQAALGWPVSAPCRAGSAPCLVAAPAKDPLIAPAKLAALAQAMQAKYVELPQRGHHLWQEPRVVLDLITDLVSML